MIEDNLGVLDQILGNHSLHTNVSKRESCIIALCFELLASSQKKAHINNCEQ